MSSNVLGVNGWVRGIHDPSAALFRSGELVAAVEEERFARRKHCLDQLPYQAIAYCLRAGDISVGELDVLALGWDVDQLLELDSGVAARLDDATLLELFLPLALFPERRGRTIEVVRVGHHHAHAAAAFVNSGFTEAAIVIMDGSGEYASTTLARAGRASGVELLRSHGFGHSLGIFYEALTEYLGFGRFQEGRVMGLAGYGEVRERGWADLDFNEQPARWDPSREPEKAIKQRWLARFEASFGLPCFAPRWRFEPRTGICRPELELSALQREIAATGQAWLVRQVELLARLALTQTGLDHIVLGGGVALNCPANQAVVGLVGPGRVFVPPAPGDAGVAIGAAAVAIWAAGGQPRAPRELAYGGPEFGRELVVEELERCGLRYRIVDEPARAIAESIAAGEVVAAMHGRLEFGPRALGHRSILADPRTLAQRDRVNRIKGREAWRPLAPSVKAEAVATYFAEADSPYMSFSVPATELTRTLAPGVVHVDGSARLQTVDAALAPEYWAVLDAVEREIGLPLVLNTSFNIGHEPIVCAPLDAIRSFAGSGLDRLFIGEVSVSKIGT